MNEKFLDDLSQSLGLQEHFRNDDDATSAAMLHAGASEGFRMVSPASETRSTDATSSAAGLVDEPRQSHHGIPDPQPGRTHHAQDMTDLQSTSSKRDAIIDKMLSLTVPECSTLLNHILESPDKEKSSPAAVTQTAGRPKHVCIECGKIFKRAHNLKIHGRLHSGAKPYRCPFEHCDKEFRWKSSIVSHLNWHRTKRGETLPGFDGIRDFGLIARQLPSLVVHTPRERTSRDKSAKHAAVYAPPTAPAVAAAAASSAAAPRAAGGPPLPPPSAFEIPAAERYYMMSGPVSTVTQASPEAQNNIVAYMSRWGDALQPTGPLRGTSAPAPATGALPEEGNTVFTPSTRTGSEGEAGGSPRFFEFDGLCPALPFLADCGGPELCERRGGDDGAAMQCLQDRFGYPAAPSASCPIPTDRAALACLGGDAEKDECAFAGMVDIPLFVFSTDGEQ
jgi:hypothetical protein